MFSSSKVSDRLGPSGLSDLYKMPPDPDIRPPEEKMKEVEEKLNESELTKDEKYRLLLRKKHYH
jgi:hypothetical protein